MYRRVVALLIALSFALFAACGGDGGGGQGGAAGGGPLDGGAATGGTWGSGGNGGGGADSGGTGGTTGNCAHAVCDFGGPLTPGCDPCVTQVCAIDATCCNSTWDGQCIQLANQLCNAGCTVTGSGGFGNTGGFGATGGSGGGGGCSQATCDGCCDAGGKCVSTTLQNKTICGEKGASCVDCSANGSVCSGGRCTECKPKCDGKKCGDADGCGGVCSAECPTGEFCGVGHSGQVAACLKCGPSTCPFGCCSAEGKCQVGNKRTTCGSNGALCANCGAQACNDTNPGWGQPNYSCGPCGASCPSSSPSSPQCADDGCGKLCPNAACDQKYGPLTCSLQADGSAQCVSSTVSQYCDSLSCASGCCDYSGGGFGKCLPGFLPSQCGSDAVLCVDCVSKGDTCSTVTQTCSSCTPNCTGKLCGSPDGCGSRCKGKDGAVCPGSPPGVACSDNAACECATSGHAICFNSVTKKNECRDTLGDANNCGGCDIKCPANSKCTNGSCECPAGSLFCVDHKDKSLPGVCTNLASDPKNCGWCTKACPAACTEGVCDLCPSGKTACSSPTLSCYDLKNDASNCGKCGTACPSGVACVAGACACPSGLVSCNGKCSDTKTDAANCGGCGIKCPNGVACSGGTCQCPGGTTFCGNTCTNTDVDPNHCGQCNTVCAFSCSAGKCQ